MEQAIKFRNLRADEIEVRVGEKKNGMMTLLLYQDARCGMRILDETVGQFGWACQYKEEKGTLFCGIALQSPDGTWLWKWNAGAPSNFESEKGEASDAFKRSCVCWGIGRSLYSAPKIRIPESNYNHKVSYIDYAENGSIKDLQIVDSRGNLVYNFMGFKVVPIEELPREEILKAVCAELKAQPDIDKESLKKFYYYFQQRCEGFDSWSAGLVRNLWKKWQERSK